MNELRNLSIVVPVGPKESYLERLLRSFPKDIEIGELVVVNTGKTFPIATPEQFNSFRVIIAEPGRANQINTGVRAATCSHIWVLHADSVVERNNLFEINYQLPRLGNRLGYFQLRFIDSEGMNLDPQELGVLFRSRVLRMPFGDQGFVFAKETAIAISLFRTEVRYGEDHDFVWRWKLRGNKLLGFQSHLKTSARKYKKGVYRLTVKYLYLTFKQALPYFFKSG